MYTDIARNLQHTLTHIFFEIDLRTLSPFVHNKIMCADFTLNLQIDLKQLISANSELDVSSYTFKITRADIIQNLQHYICVRSSSAL
jgi:hypothetical protein